MNAHVFIDWNRAKEKPAREAGSAASPSRASSGGRGVLCDYCYGISVGIGMRKSIEYCSKYHGVPIAAFGCTPVCAAGHIRSVPIAFVNIMGFESYNEGTESFRNNGLNDAFIL